MTSEREPTPTRERIQRLLRPERAERLDPFMILSLIGINLHDTVADIGCGPGYFSVPLGKYLIHGKVYALDIDEEMVAACRERVTRARLGNVEVMQCGEFDFPLQKNALNGAFVAFVVHQSSDKPRLLQAVRELLRPRAWCAVLEWHRKETELGPPLERRIDPPELETLAQEVSLSPRGWRHLNNDQYMMVLRKS